MLTRMKTILLSMLLVLSIVPLSYAAPLPQVLDAYNGLFFRNAEVLIDKDGDGKISKGDVLWGVLKLNEIVAPTNEFGQVGPAIWPGAPPAEITGYFATEVVAVLPPGSGAPTLTDTIIFGPATDPNGILMPGEVLRIFEDTSADYNDSTQGVALATATDGTLLWSMGMGPSTDGSSTGGYWYSLAPSIIPTAGAVGTSYAGLNIIIAPPSSSFGPVNDPNEDYSGGAGVPGGVNTQFWFNSEIFRLPGNPGLTISPSAPMHFGSNDPAVYFPKTPRPCYTIEKQVWDELAQEWKDADTADTAVGLVDGAKYRIVVTNCGPVDLVNITITDPELKITYTVASLPVDDVPVILTEIEIPALNQPVRCAPPTTKENIAYGSVIVNGEEITVQDSAWIKCLCIEIKKEVLDGATWKPADTVADAVPIVDDATYRLIVTNCGSVDLIPVLVDDPILGITNVNIGQLLVGQSTTLTSIVPGFENLFKKDRCNPLDPPGNKLNTATATGTFNGNQVSDSDPAWVACTPCTGTIGNQLWIDVNGNGLYDAGTDMVPPAGTMVELLNSSGVVVATTFSAANGTYGFSNVCVGTYQVRVTTPAGYVPVPQLGSVNTDNDNDGTANGMYSQSSSFALAAGESKQTIDFGFRENCTASIGNQLWIDVNGNGMYDAGTDMVPPEGTKVELLDSSNVVVATTFSAANGTYGFSNVCVGTYQVWVTTPAGYAPVPQLGSVNTDNDNDGTANGIYSQSASFTLAVGENKPTIDFGFYKPMPSIDIEKYTNGDDADMPTGPKVPVDSTVTWTYVVTNTGNVDLANVVVTDDKLIGTICSFVTLPAGASQTCTKTGTAVMGQYANMGTVTGTYNGTTVTDQDPSHYYGVKSSIDVEKYVSNDGGKTWHDADDEPGLSVPLCTTTPPAPTCGSCYGGITELTLLYKGYKEAKVVVKDDDGRQLYSGTVYPNKTFTFKGMDSYGTMTNYIKIYKGDSYDTIYTDCSKPIYPGMIVGSYTVVSGYSKKGGLLCAKTSSYSDKDDNHYASDHKCSSSCSSYSDSSSSSSSSSYSSSTSYSGWWSSFSEYTKDDDDDDHSSYDESEYDKAYSSSCGTLPVYPSCKVQFKFVATNTGNTDLSFITLFDDVYGDLAGKCTTPIPATLTPGQVYTCIIGPYPAEAGQHTNTATVTGKFNGFEVSDSDKANYFGGKPTTGCVRSPGYWKNHPEAWPVETIVIGGVTYTKSAAIKIMEKPVAGDKTYTMFPALVSAKLNVLAGADATCISDVIVAADSWMAKYPVGSGVNGDSYAWSTGEPLYLKLDKYNNGYLCAAYCGDQVPPPMSYPKIDIEKYTNGYDADMAPGPYIWVGDQVKWTYVVKNTGNTTLTGIKVTDDKVPAISCPKSSLMPGESMTCTASGTATEGQYENTGCVEGYTSGSVKVSDCDLSHYYGKKQQTQTSCGTGTPGYWKNHPEAWPTGSIVIGGITYSKDQAIAIISKSVSGDKTYTLFPALVAAKLNVMSGNNASCISSTITAADAWMKNYRPGSGVTGSSTAWKQAEPYYWALDNYNNGLLCAPHRDSSSSTCGSNVPSECLISEKDS